VPHTQSLRYLHQSDVLLMCAITQPSGQGEKFPAKGFEYLYLRKPVLCLSAPGVTTELLARSGLGTVVDPADLAGIKAALRAFYDRRHQPARGDAAFIARFDRRRLTEQLAGIFDTLAGVPNPTSVAA
jgi:glycosyltransferase involved in cell wall biosynthesis